MCSRKMVSFTILGIAVCICVVNIPTLIGFKPSYNIVFDTSDINFVFYGQCLFCCTMENVLVRLVVMLFDVFIPFCVILCCNIKISLCLYRNRKKCHSRLRSGSTSLTSMLLIVSFTFLVSTLPYIVFAVLHAYTVDLYRSYSVYFCRTSLWFVTVLSLASMNYSINFLLYCIGSIRFKQQFCRMVGCKAETTISRISLNSSSENRWITRRLICAVQGQVTV